MKKILPLIFTLNHFIDMLFSCNQMKELKISKQNKLWIRLVGWLVAEFNVTCQHKYGYIRDERQVSSLVFNLHHGHFSQYFFHAEPFASVDPGRKAQ